MRRRDLTGAAAVNFANIFCFDQHKKHSPIHFFYTRRVYDKELQETAKVFAPALAVAVTVSEEAAVEVDHGLFLTVAENLIGNAARFAQRRLEIVLVKQRTLSTSRRSHN